MSKKQSASELVCPYCGKSGFKSSKGYQQHVSRSIKCKEQHEASISSNTAETRAEALEWTKKLLADNAKRLAGRHGFDPNDKHFELLLSHDADAVASSTVEFQLGDAFDAEAGDTGSSDGNDFVLEADDDSSQDQGFVDQDEVSTDQQDEEMDTQSDEEGPSTRGRDDFVAFCRQYTFFAPLSQAEERGIRLMEVLRQKKAPINAYPALMRWHLQETGVLKASQKLKDAGPEHYIGRNTLLKRLAKRYNLEGKGPQEKVVRLPSSKEVVKIPVFDAEDKVVELLTNPRLTPEDFDFFDDDPLAPPPEDIDYVGNLNTGAGFAATYDALIKEENQQLLGTPFYIDGAVTGQFSDLPVTAVKFSLTCFTRKARLKAHMWAILGYLPQVKVAESRGKKLLKDSLHLEAEDLQLFNGEGEEVDIDADDEEDTDYPLTGVKAQDFHFMLSVILEPMVKLQQTGMIWNLMHKSRYIPGLHFELYVPIVRCDTEEADALCGKYKPRTRNVKQLCRQCEVPTMEASNHLANYPAKTQAKIKKLVQANNVQKLQEMSQHYLKNAWYNCRFNQANDRGIHGACPSEMLHAMQLGIFKYTRDIFFQSLGEAAQVSHDINGLARVYGKLLSRQSDRSLPNTNFSKGIRDGKLMAKDYRGVLLVMAMVLRSTQGRTMLGTKRAFNQDHKKDDWLLLVETLLQWESYLCRPRMQLKHVKRLDKKHRYIMYMMKKVANRTKGMGLNIMKFHAIVHLMEDIIIHGIPLEFDTAADESHHKESKLAARLTQRNEANFNFQVATRKHEFHILDLALHELATGQRISDYFDIDSEDEDGNMSAGGSNSVWSGEMSNQDISMASQEDDIITDDARISVFWDDETQAVGFELRSRSRYTDQTAMNNDLLTFLHGLQELLMDYLPGNRINIFTRHKRGTTIFHGHPNYRGQGPWKDWAVVDWVGWGQLPCHISCFVVLDCVPASRNGLQYGGVTLKNTTYAVVESCQLEEDDGQGSDFFQSYLKEVARIDNGEVVARKFYLAETEAFLRPCAMVPDIGGPPNGYFMVKSRDEWFKDFVTWVEQPHVDDDMTEETEED